MPGSGQVFGLGMIIDEHFDGCRPIKRRDTRRGAMNGMDGFAHGRSVAGGILLGHQGDFELFKPGWGRRYKWHAPPEFDHEIDCRRRTPLPGDHQIALIFAVLIVHQDDQLSRLDVFQNFGNRTKGHINTS